MAKQPTLLLILCLAVTSAWSQGNFQPNYKTLTLNDLSSFRPQAGNWMTVSEVTMDRSRSIHPEKPAEEPVTKKKKKKAPPAPVWVHPVQYTAGQGILLNFSNDLKHDQLVTNWNHGDIELEMEAMIPKGSNSGIYLQGNYEVQLFDSWGVKNPSFSDIGGIYRNWETTPDKAYAGKAPRMNAAKAPGLWQKLKISFQAPRFDASGQKTENARFVFVELNGIRIHDNVEVPRLTGGPLHDREVAEGPLMIQGDHGPVAFRNIRYRLIKPANVSLSGINYEVFEGHFGSEADFKGLKPTVIGSTDKLTWEVAEKNNDFAIKYYGAMEVLEATTYKFSPQTGNSMRLVIDGNTVFNFNERKGGALSLTKGTHAFEITYYKSVPWYSPNMGLWVETPSSYPQALHSFGSFPPASEATSPILVETGANPKLLRAFLDYESDYGKRLTHTIAVGNPEGLNYIYDLKSGSIVCIWRGGFIDATPMWHDRGDGSYRPIGTVEYLTCKPTLIPAGLSNNAELNNLPGFTNKGYMIDKGGLPIFKYEFQGIKVEDKTVLIEEGKALRREIKAEGATNAKFRLAEGSRIVQLKDGVYAINDAAYFLEVKSGQQPSIVQNGNVQELIVPASSQLVYQIVW